MSMLHFPLCNNLGVLLLHRPHRALSLRCMVVRTAPPLALVRVSLRYLWLLFPGCFLRSADRLPQLFVVVDHVGRAGTRRHDDVRCAWVQRQPGMRWNGCGRSELGTARWRPRGRERYLNVYSPAVARAGGLGGYGGWYLGWWDGPKFKKIISGGEPTDFC